MLAPANSHEFHDRMKIYNKALQAGAQHSIEFINPWFQKQLSEGNIPYGNAKLHVNLMGLRKALSIHTTSELLHLLLKFGRSSHPADFLDFISKNSKNSLSNEVIAETPVLDISYGY